MHDRDELTVSEEKLRTMFLEFKLELFTELAKYATAASLTDMAKHLEQRADDNAHRIALLELWKAGSQGSVNARQKFSTALVAWVGIAVAAVTSLIAIVWQYHH